MQDYNGNVNKIVQTLLKYYVQCKIIAVQTYCGATFTHTVLPCALCFCFHVRIYTWLIQLYLSQTFCFLQIDSGSRALDVLETVKWTFFLHGKFWAHSSASWNSNPSERLCIANVCSVSFS